METLYEFLVEKTFWSVATILLSIAGVLLAVRLTRSLKGSSSETLQHLRHLYAADGWKFFITGCFGVAGFVNVPSQSFEWLWELFYILRVPILLYLIWALWRFSRHIEKLQNSK